MALSLKEVAIAAPFQISTMLTIMAVGYAHDFPAQSDIVTLPVAGMIVGAVVIGVAYVMGAIRDRKHTTQNLGSVA